MVSLSGTTICFRASGTWTKVRGRFRPSFPSFDTSPYSVKLVRRVSKSVVPTSSPAFPAERSAGSWAMSCIPRISCPWSYSSTGILKLSLARSPFAFQNVSTEAYTSLQYAPAA